MSDTQPAPSVADNLRGEIRSYIELRQKMVGTLYPSIIDDILVDLDGQLSKALYPTPSQPMEFTPTPASRQTAITIDDSGLPVPKNRRY